MNQARAGARCRTLCNVITAKGLLPRDTQGILLYEESTLGRRVVVVDWGNGTRTAVLPHEIAVLKPEGIHSESRLFSLGEKPSRQPDATHTIAETVDLNGRRS